MANRQLVVTIIGDAAPFQGALAAASSSAVGFAGKMESVGASMSSIGKTLMTHLSLPLAAIGAVSTKAAVDFQNSMELLHTQAGVGQGAIAGLSKEVLALSGQVATAPNVLTQGIYHLASQGLRGAQAMEALKIAAEGARLGQANLEDVTNALGAAIVSGIKGSQDYTQAMGQLNAIVGSGDMHMQDLADAMGTGLPAKAAVAGVSLRDVGAALAVFGDNNIRGAEAGTLLNSTLRLMEGPSKAAQKAMEGIGLGATQLGQDLRQGGIVQALSDLKSHLEGMPKAEQFAELTHMFGGRQAGGVMVLIDQLERLKTKEKEVAAGGAGFADAWKSYTDTAAFHLAQAGAQMQAAGISIGTVLLPVVAAVADKISMLANKFGELPGPIKDAILVLGGVLVVVGPLVSSIGALATVLGFLAANPLVLVIAGLAALVGAVAAAVIWPDKLRQVLEDMGVSAGTAGQIVGDLQQVFAVVKAAGEALVSAIRANWSTISAIVTGAVDIIRTTITVALALIEAVWHKWGDDILAVIRADWNLIRGLISSDLEVIRGVIDLVTGLIHGDWSKAWQGLKEIVGGTLDGIRTVIRTSLDVFVALMDAAGKLIAIPFQTAFNAIRAVVVAAFNAGLTATRAFVKAVEAIPGEITALFKGAGDWLYGAGQALIQGLINGLTSELDHLKNIATDIAHKITSWKGPIEADRVLLVPQGKAIMAGLMTGMQAQLPALRTLSTSVGPMISRALGAPGAGPAIAGATGAAASVGAVAGASGAGQPIYVTVNGWVGSDQQIAERLARELSRMGRNGHNFSFGSVRQLTPPSLG